MLRVIFLHGGSSDRSNIHRQKVLFTASAGGNRPCTRASTAAWALAASAAALLALASATFALAAATSASALALATAAAFSAASLCRSFITSPAGKTIVSARTTKSIQRLNFANLGWSDSFFGLWENHSQRAKMQTQAMNAITSQTPLAAFFALCRGHIAVASALVALAISRAYFFARLPIRCRPCLNRPMMSPPNSLLQTS